MDNGGEFLDFCSLSREEMLQMTTDANFRSKFIVPVSQVKPAEVLKLQSLTWFQHIVCIVFLGCGVPNGVFVVPGLTYLIGRFVLDDVALAFKGLAVLLAPLALVPQPFVPSTLQSWLAYSMLKYFSFRFIMEKRPTPMPSGPVTPTNELPRPQILVAPPHGVFPYGNILSMLVRLSQVSLHVLPCNSRMNEWTSHNVTLSNNTQIWPSMTGHHFNGLAASSALRVPGFKQILRSIGVVDASRDTARKVLEHFPYTIGISTGGVAEVFETNANDECILLKDRVGLIKLAIRTGADLVPCYMFGNTKLLSCWAGEGIPGARTIMESISRKVGFATILIFGRFGLPIPYRVPIVAVLGKPIPTHHLKAEEPTSEHIAIVQQQLIDDMLEIFDKYKGLYGWDDKRLVIR